mmetsp:Transcript_41644/g.130051  ORF Transcript_41644/g.130051 Transcript_41644/m.130051 type:complete len:91 (-) Transcript_41644:543-815(-)
MRFSLNGGHSSKCQGVRIPPPTEVEPPGCHPCAALEVSQGGCINGRREMRGNPNHAEVEGHWEASGPGSWCPQRLCSILAVAALRAAQQR